MFEFSIKNGKNSIKNIMVCFSKVNCADFLLANASVNALCNTCIVIKEKCLVQNFIYFQTYKMSM